MRVKRFVAPTMQEAVERVRAEFGPEAIILQTRTYRRGLFGLFGPRRTEVLAAVDQRARREATSTQAPPAQAAAPAGLASLWTANPLPTAAGGPPPASPPPGASPAVQERAALLGQQTSAQPAFPAGPTTSPQGPWGVPAAPAGWAANGHVQAPGMPAAGPEEAAPAVRVEVREAVPPPAGADPSWPPGLEKVYQRLVDRAVEPPFARQVVDGLVPLVAPGAQLPEERLFELARDHLAGLIPVSPSLRLGDGPRRVMVLVGPTGVGKTTSLAKLAAHYGLMAGHPVGLITFDTYRVGAAEQLRTYAEIIGLPMEVVYHPGELEATLNRMADRQLLLVDTAGRSPQDLMRLQEMRAYLRLLPDPEVYLVLSATVRYADMVRAVERFEPLGFRHLIITKVDETTAPGMLLNAVMFTGRPLAYISTGQDVPDDFEVADPDRVAAQLLEESHE